MEHEEVEGTKKNISEGGAIERSSRERGEGEGGEQGILRCYWDMHCMSEPPTSWHATHGSILH